MLQYQPITQNMDIADVEDALPSVVTQVSRKEARVIVEEGGEAVAAIISMEDWRKLARLEAEREKRFAVLERARAGFAGVPDEEIEAEFDRALGEVRARARTEAKRD